MATHCRAAAAAPAADRVGGAATATASRRATKLRVRKRVVLQAQLWPFDCAALRPAGRAAGASHRHPHSTARRRCDLAASSRATRSGQPRRRAADRLCGYVGSGSAHAVCRLARLARIPKIRALRRFMRVFGRRRRLADCCRQSSCCCLKTTVPAACRSACGSGRRPKVSRCWPPLRRRWMTSRPVWPLSRPISPPRCGCAWPTCRRRGSAVGLRPWPISAVTKPPSATHGCCTRSRSSWVRRPSRLCRWPNRCWMCN